MGVVSSAVPPQSELNAAEAAASMNF